VRRSGETDSGLATSPCCSATASSSRARARLPRVKRALPVSSRKRSSVCSNAAWRSEPCASGSGSGSSASGRSSRSTNQATGQPIQRSIEDADQGRAASSSKQALVAQRLVRALARRPPSHAQALGDRRRRVHRTERAALARAEQALLEQVADVVDEQRARRVWPSSSALCQLSTSRSSGRDTAAYSR